MQFIGDHYASISINFIVSIFSVTFSIIMLQLIVISLICTGVMGGTPYTDSIGDYNDDEELFRMFGSTSRHGNTDWCDWYDNCTHNESPEVQNENCLPLFHQLFPESRVCNLADIHYSRTLYSKEDLKQALHRTEAHVMTTEVALGELIGTDEIDVPILAAIDEKESDISLDMFLKEIVSHNDLRLYGPPKAVKVKFHVKEVLDRSFKTLMKYYRHLRSLLIVAADVIAGPPMNHLPSIGPNDFLSKVRRMPDALVLLGWTQRYGFRHSKAYYAYTHVNHMLIALANNKILNPVSFSIRAGIAAHSTFLLLKLVEGGYSSTSLTIWTGQHDQIYVDKKQLLKLIHSVGYNKVFLQLPPGFFRGIDDSKVKIINENSMGDLGESRMLQVDMPEPGRFSVFDSGDKPESWWITEGTVAVQ